MASISQANAWQEATSCEPSQNFATVTVEAQDQNAPRSSIRSAKPPGILPNRACLLIGVLSAGVPVPPKNFSEVDPVKFDDRLTEFHRQA